MMAAVSTALVYPCSGKMQVDGIYPHPGTLIHENGGMSKKLRKLLAENLKAAMKRQGIVQSDIESRVGIGQSSVSRVLREETGVTLDLLEELARAVGMQPWELLVDEEATREQAIRQILRGGRSEAA